jgi:hypothetical protein
MTYQNHAILIKVDADGFHFGAKPPKQYNRLRAFCNTHADRLQKLGDQHNAILSIYWNDHDTEAKVMIMSSEHDRHEEFAIVNMQLPPNLTVVN